MVEGSMSTCVSSFSALAWIALALAISAASSCWAARGSASSATAAATRNTEFTESSWSVLGAADARPSALRISQVPGVATCAEATAVAPASNSIAVWYSLPRTSSRSLTRATYRTEISTPPPFCLNLIASTGAGVKSSGRRAKFEARVRETYRAGTAYSSLQHSGSPHVRSVRHARLCHAVDARRTGHCTGNTRRLCAGHGEVPGDQHAEDIADDDGPGAGLRDHQQPAVLDRRDQGR